MGHDHPAAHAAGVRIGPDPLDRVAEHPRVASFAVTGKLGADGVGLQVGHAVDGYRSVRVLQQDRPGQFGDLGAQVHAGLIQQGAAEAEPTGGVVIAADQHDPGPGVVQPEQRVLAHLDRVHRGHGPVVDVPRDQHHVHPLRADRGNEVVKERGLRRAQIGPVQ